MSRVQRTVWFAVAVLCAVSVTVYALSYIVTQPWHILPDIGGDGAKNNFTYLYQCLYGKGIWFDGMNYPYGEHIVYTDGQPLLSVAFTHFKHVTVGQALTVCWSLMGLSYVIGMLFLYRILSYFKVSPLPAILFACLIGIFTPQILRLQSHYALSYTCLIPMLFYWTLKYHEQYHFRYCIYVFVTGCIMAFIHPYYAAIILIWTLFYGLGYFIYVKIPLMARVKHIMPLLVSVLCIFAVVGITMKLTDPITDRPGAPLSTFGSCTKLKEIVTSANSTVWQLAEKANLIKPKDVSDGGEGYTYVGLVTLIAVLGYGIYLLRRKYKKSKGDTTPAPAYAIPPIWLFMAFGVLLFSMGVPFIWNMEWLMDYLSIFKQFRATGRFSWIFYYLITVYSVVIVYRTAAAYIARKKLAAGYAILIGAIALWSFEANGYAKWTQTLAVNAAYNYDMMFSVKEQTWTAFMQEQNHKGADFQAIIIVPFYHIGTEKLWVGDPGWLLTLGTKAAMQLQLPVVDVMMSRSSWAQAMKQVKIAAGPYADKPILNDIKSDKPFLLLHFEDDTLDADQKYLLESSDYIGKHSQCNVYACYPRRLAANQKKYADSINKILPYMPVGDSCITNTGWWHVIHFDEQAASPHIFGKGAAKVVHSDDSLIATMPVTPGRDSQEYEFSAWFLLGGKDYRSPYVTMQLLDSAGNVISTIDALTKQSLDNTGMWFRCNRFFYMSARCRQLKCTIMNSPAPTYEMMDELMLRPADALIISKDAEGKVMVNNHVFMHSH